jgi:adenine deaminase
MQLEGNIVDVATGQIYPGKIVFGETITKIQKTDKKYENFILPGFIDSHIRIEDSMLSPVEFTKCALKNGVTTIVEDFSGYLSVVGSEGIKYLITEFNKLPIEFYYLYPLNIENSEYEQGPEEVKIDEFISFVKHKQCLGLTQIDDAKKIEENDSLFLKRINAAKTIGKPIISNIPKIGFNELGKFTQLGIRADIGSNIYQEAFEKACFGIKIKIVEGTKRKTLANLVRLAKQFDTTIISEEKSTFDLARGYMRMTLKKAVALGLDPITAIKNVTVNPAKLLGINEGVIAEGRNANLVEVKNIKDFEILKVYQNGKLVVKNGKALLKSEIREPRSKFDSLEIKEEHIQIETKKNSEKVKVIVMNQPPSLEEFSLTRSDNSLQNDLSQDILKVAVMNRYGKNTVSIGFVKGFGLQKGAIATTVHGSTGNVIAIGTSDTEIVQAINAIRKKGGVALIDKKRELVFPLPIFGIVSNEEPEVIIEEYKKMVGQVKRLGPNFEDPFLVLGQLGNVRLPGYRITESGLIDTITDTPILIVKE